MFTQERTYRWGQVWATYVEIKGARGSLSPAQRQWRDAALARGAEFHTVRSLEEMTEVLTGLGITLRARLAA